MPKETTPTPPSAAPASAPQAAPAAPRPVKAAAAKAAPDVSRPVVTHRDESGRFAPKSLIPERTPRPVLTPRAALKLDEDAFTTNNRTLEAARASVARVDPKPRPAEVAPPADPLPDLEAPEASPEGAAAAAPAPAKVTIGDKEYTPEELQAHLKELHDLKNAPPAPVAAAPAPEAPRAAAVPPPTKEEIAAQEAAFIERTGAALEAPLTEAEVDTLLGGGKEAVALMTNLRKRDMATAILHARKGIAEGLNPIIEEIFKGLTPLAQQHEQLQRYNITQQFVAKHKDFAPHLDLATNIAEELLKRFPDQVKALSADQFIDEVARQTDLQLSNQWKRWNPGSTGSWRDKAATPVPPAAPPTAPPAVPPPAPASAPTRAAIRPPVGAAPQQPAFNRNTWQSQVAKTLTGRR